MVRDKLPEPDPFVGIGRQQSDRCRRVAELCDLALPATDRTLHLRWFWKYDIAAGAEFRARLRLSNDVVTSVDLTNPVAEYNFTVSGAATDFEMFETMIALPDGVRSFDLTFISGGAVACNRHDLHRRHFGSYSRRPHAHGDYNQNGVVDAADYVVWRKGLGTTYMQNDYDVWRTHFGQTVGGGSGPIGNSTIPEPATAVVLIVGMLAMFTGRRATVSQTHSPVTRTEIRPL